MLPEIFFSSLLERVDDVVWAVGCPDLQLEYLNPAAAVILGRPVRAFEEDPDLWLTIVHPDDREAVAASHDHLLQEGEVERRYRILRPGGETVWMYDRAWLMRDSDGQPLRLFGIAREVTSEMLERQRLNSTLQLHRRFLESALDPIFVVKVESDDTFVFRYNNPAHRQQTGISLEMIRHQTPDALLDKAQAAAVKAHYRECVQLKRPIQYEERLALPAGERDWQTQLVPVEDSAGRVVELVGVARDITPLKQAERQSRDAFEALDQLGQQLPGFIYQYLLSPSGEGRFLYASRRSIAIYGATPDELARSDTAAFNVIHPDDRESVRAAVEVSAATLSHWHCEYRVRHPRGHELWAEGLATPERLEGGSVLWHGYIADVSERKRLQLELEASEARFRRLATVDMLTGAPNRRCFIDCLEGELARMKRHGGKACLVMFDADHFKRINDTFGHAAGDQVLKALVYVGEQWLRGSDVLGRLGGEEFAILMPETDYQGALALSERFRRAVADLLVDAGERVVQVTVSLGVVALRAQDSPDSALERADRMLYRAKALGRNRTCGERDRASE
ncbi:diguanylate cyclase [Halomonas mongoliensis]|uniref:diguanylate cyclase n=1 Tax=Halomonas mongoliensis TaxID=321265 RepID=A0ABU1GPU2_9GAMM|nr:diguanylate cyclase [Halomonas mongoliensis]MDR5893586.1 diguanylate cyclase [Halomonas mongoliensis]